MVSSDGMVSSLILLERKYCEIYEAGIKPLLLYKNHSINNDLIIKYDNL